MTRPPLDREDLKPKSADGTSRGFAMATVVHIGLVVAIAAGVSWRASEPEGVDAEIWANVPTAAAQRDVAPEPAPPPKPAPAPAPRPEPKPAPAPPPKVEAPDPQIAIEKAKQEKVKKQREEEKREREEEAKKKREEDRREKEELAKKKAADDKAKEAKAEADRKKSEQALQKQRDENLARMRDMMGANTGSSTSTAAQSAGPSAGYAGRIKAQVKPNIVFTENLDNNPQAEVEVRTGPNGTIISSRLLKSSGVKAWDDAVVRAIERTGVLPRDIDGRVPSPMVIAFRPRDL